MVSERPRAVVVDDSRFMRTVISDILEGGGVEVVDTAADGADAVEVVEEVRPDVVTMDIEMPEVDGVAAVERIMERCPTPVLMLSAHAADGADVTFEALDCGAVDFFTKPGGEVSVEMSRFEDELVEKVHAVARADVGTAGRDAGPATTPSTTTRTYPETATVIVGSSTGGPSVVEDVLADLSAETGARVLVVQHMPDAFTGRFAERLDAASDFAVQEAGDGDRIGAGEAAVAPGGYHLRVAGDRGGRLRVELTEEAPVNGVRPAIDVTMGSAAGTVEGAVVGVVLTGMGEDGAGGVEALAGVGADIVAQDEATSAVYGMPKRAVETGCVDVVRPAGEIAAAVVDALAISPTEDTP
jgi:two-component system chemotaxis response regulator CheB